MTLLENELGLWWAALTCTVAAAFTLWGAMKGVPQHRIPRVILGVATAVIAVSYWLDFLDTGWSPAEMRRGAGFVLWPALAWTAWSGVVYSRKVVAATQQLLESSDEK